MLEVFGNHNIEKKQDTFNSPKNQISIKKQVTEFYKKNQENPDTIQNLKELLTRQNTEDLNLFELLKTKKELVLEESRTNIDKIRLENYERIVNQIKSNLINIQKSKDKNFDKTGKLIDDLYGFFGGETTENVYKQSFDRTKIQASQLLNKILKNVNKRNLSEKDKIRYKNLVTDLIKISKIEIKPTKNSGLTIEELKTAPERINLEIEGIKGEVNGIISGSKNIIVGTVDLLKFIVKYPLFKEYRKEINKEVGKIYNFCVENGITGLKDKIGYILVKEIERIGKLPKEDQAKEIGKISGNVIASLLTIKATDIGFGKLKKIKELRNMNKVGVINDGVEKIGEADSLYNKKGYEFLRKHKDILGENLNINDVVGEGTQAIIIKHPKRIGEVIKIAREGNVDDLIQEFNNHKLFSEKVRNGKKSGEISKQIKVPRIKILDERGYFLMEKIEGQSLYSKALIGRYEKEVLETKEFLESLTDKGLKELLINKYNQSESILDMVITDYSGQYLSDLLGYGYKNRGPTDLSKAFDYLRKQGISHGDLHPGNIMLDKEGNIYIIDFGRIKNFN